jgi:hypothetical protein
MVCQIIGRAPISTIGFGRTAVSSLKRVPRPPARMTASAASLRLQRCLRIRIPRSIENAPSTIGLPIYTVWTSPSGSTGRAEWAALPPRDRLR